MSESDNFEPPDPTDRPLCSNCGWTMWIAQIEPHEPDSHKHIYKCSRCENEEIIIIKL